MLSSIDWTILYALRQECVSLDITIEGLANQDEFGVYRGKDLSRLNIVRQYMEDRIEEIERKVNEAAA